MELSKQALLSTAEVIKCVEKDAYDLSSSTKIMDILYGDNETTSDNIVSITTPIMYRYLPEISRMC